MLKFYRFVDLRPAVILSKLSAMKKYKTKTFPFFNPTRCKLVLKNFQWDDVKVYKKNKNNLCNNKHGRVVKSTRYYKQLLKCDRLVTFEPTKSVSKMASLCTLHH